MLHSSRSMSDERGSAAVEFITVGVVLLVPLVYLILVLGTVQSHTLGAEAAARHAARTVAAAPDASSAATRAAGVLASVAHEYDMDPDSLTVSITCTPTGPACPRAGATVHVRISTRVSLPFVPSVFGLERFASVPIEASAVHKVSRWAGAG